MNCPSQKNDLFKHAKCGIPSNCDVKGDGHRVDAIGFATGFEDIPTNGAGPNGLGDFAKLNENRFECRSLIGVDNKSIEEGLNYEIDDMCEAGNMVDFRVPINVDRSEEFLQFHHHLVVVACIISGNAKQLFSEVVLFEDFENGAGKEFTSVAAVEMFECKKILMKFEFGIDIVTGDRYTC